MLDLDVLSEKYVQELKEIFNSKNWFTYDEDVNEIFQRFCERMSRLNDDSQRDLIVELTKEYLWVPGSQYEAYLKKALMQLINENDFILNNNNTKNKVIVCPLVKNKNNVVKSGVFMAYLCQSILVQMLPMFERNKVRICMINDLKSYKESISEMIILIDDYLGSGSTALEFLAELSGSIPNDKISIVCLVAQEEGINLLRQNQIRVYAAEKRKKAISDIYSELEAKRRKQLMKQISKQLGVEDDSLLGYEASESLVSMIRTPNNTFPFYWIEKKGNCCRAPFKRKTLYYDSDMKRNMDINEKNK